MIARKEINVELPRIGQLIVSKEHASSERCSEMLKIVIVSESCRFLMSPLWSTTPTTLPLARGLGGGGFPTMSKSASCF